LLADGAIVCATLADLAGRADVIITMLPDTPDVEKAWFDPGGIAAGLVPGKVVIDMSSISPIATKEFANRIEAKEAGYLDAPVSGGEVARRMPRSRSWPAVLTEIDSLRQTGKETASIDPVSYGAYFA